MLVAHRTSDSNRHEAGAPLSDLLISAISVFLSPIREGICRALIWSHHLLSTQKRKNILAWSKELMLGGVSRPGYLGVILAEGEKNNVQELMTRLKSLSWQALQVRHEECRNEWLLGDDGRCVVEVEAVSEIVKGLKGCPAGPKEGDRLSKWFLEKMKIK
ncbi:hypothetical protein EV426DRAFT_534605 [Tirmania nivea]|nr:hypothetical protein EV426DRAFT_534605 [Tirmania nivea]